MIYEIRMTPEAKSDLRGIYEYIAFDLQSIQNVSGQFERLEKSIASLIDIERSGEIGSFLGLGEEICC